MAIEKPILFAIPLPVSNVRQGNSRLRDDKDIVSGLGALLGYDRFTAVFVAPTTAADKTLTCKDCGSQFILTDVEQEFYKEKIRRSADKMS